MRSVFLVALGNLRRRKKQNLLVGLSIFLSVLLLTTAIGILGGIHKPFDAMFDRLQASHILLYYDIRQNDPEEIKSWFQNQSEVKSVGMPQHFFLITEPLTFESEKIDMMVRITEFDEHQLEQDKLLKMEGGEAISPGWGETWIPRHFSVRYNISVGDTLKIPLANGNYPLTVSAIVVDPHFASGLINPNRLWIAPGMLPFMMQTGALNKVMQGIRLHKKEDIDMVWARYNREMTYSGSNLQYGLFKSVFTSVYKIIGLVIIVFSILAIVISGYIISSIIISSVLADSQLTGVLKALGFKPIQATGIYLMQYALLMLVFIPAGLLSSFFAIKAMLGSLLKSIGLLNFNFPFFLVFVGSSLFFIILILAMIWFSSAKAGKIQPAQALRSATGDSNIHRKKNRIPMNIQRFRLTFWIALKMIADNPKKSVFSLISLVLTVFILGFSVNTSNSFNRILEYKSLWGFDNSDLQVSRSTQVILPIEHKRLLQQMKNDEMIHEVIPFSYYELSIPPLGNAPPISLNGKVFEVNPDKIGLRNIEGTHPKSANEISLCVGTAQKLQKSVGDSVVVLMENQAEELCITGIYQDISNLGEGFRLSTEAVKAVNPIFEHAHYALLLKDKSQVDILKHNLLRKYGEAIKIELTIEEQLSFMGITRSINASMILISLFFVCVLVVSVFNDIYLNIWENRKSIGIYKLIGFTPTQLQSVMIWKTWVLTIISMLIGLPLVLLIAPRLMSSITSGFGVVDFPFIYSPLGSLAATVLFIIAATLSTWWASGNMKQINPQILVNE